MAAHDTCIQTLFGLSPTEQLDCTAPFVLRRRCGCHQDSPRWRQHLILIRISIFHWPVLAENMILREIMDLAATQPKGLVR